MENMAYLISGILQGALAQEEAERRQEKEREEAQRQSLLLQMNLQELLHRQRMEEERLNMALEQNERERRMSEIQMESMRFALERNKRQEEKERRQEPIEEALRISDFVDKTLLSYNSLEEATKVINATMQSAGYPISFTPAELERRRSFVAQKQQLQATIMQNVKSTSPVQSELEQYIRLGEANGVPAGEVKAMYSAQVEANKQQYKQALQRQVEETKIIAKTKGEAEKMAWQSGGRKVFEEQQAIQTRYNIRQALALQRASGGGGGGVRRPTQGQVQALSMLQSLISAPSRFASYTPISLETDLTKVAQGSILGNSIPTIIAKANSIRSDVSKLGDPMLAEFSSSVYLLSAFNMLGDMVERFRLNAERGIGLPNATKRTAFSNIYSNPAFLSALRDFATAPKGLLLQIRDEDFWNMAVPSPDNRLQPISLREYVSRVRREDIFKPAQQAKAPQGKAQQGNVPKKQTAKQ